MCAFVQGKDFAETGYGGQQLKAIHVGQNVAPAKDLAKTVPNPMINACQQWLNGLVAAVRA